MKEFEISEFSSFCDDMGIHNDFSTPMAPQHNGIVERKNKII